MDDVTDPTTVVTPMRKRRKAAAPPPPSSALQHRVERAAKIVAKHQKVLGDMGIEAIRVATLQVVAKRLSDLEERIETEFRLIRDLLGHVNPPVAQLHKVVTPPTHACVLCGRPGVYQSKSARVEKGAQKPWYCEGEHAKWAMMEDGEAAQQARIAPSAGAPNIEAALKALNG